MRVETLDCLRDLGFPTYADYLASDLWRANKRRLGMAKSCWACKATRELQAHHCSYDNVGDEQPGELLVLCSRCHSRVHELVNNGAPLLTAHLGLMRVVRLPDGQTRNQYKQPKGSSKNQTKKRRVRKRKKKTGPLISPGAIKRAHYKPPPLGRTGIENERLHELQIANRAKQQAFKDSLRSNSNVIDDGRQASEAGSS